MQKRVEQDRGVMIVTGGGRGIGAAVARLGAARGYAVAVNFESNEAAAADVVSYICENGGRATAVRADIANEQDVVRLFDAAQAGYGPVTALVNSAGIPGTRRRLMDMAVSELTRVLDVNLYGALLCVREAMCRMSISGGGEGGGIVLLSSQVAETGGNQLATYAAAKGGINVLTKALAREVSGEGIRINALSPGVIATDQQPLDDGAWVDRMRSSIPLGRLGEPLDIATAALWLLSDEAAYINGAILGVTGGR